MRSRERMNEPSSPTTVEPIVCQHWCEDKGHPDEASPEDQTCRGEYLATYLDLVEQTEPGDVTVYAKRYNGDQAHVCVNVYVRSTDIDVPDEARRVAASLLNAAELVDVGNQSD
jgi:hypothetical protein